MSARSNATFTFATLKLTHTLVMFYAVFKNTRPPIGLETGKPARTVGSVSLVDTAISASNPRLDASQEGAANAASKQRRRKKAEKMRHWT